MPSTLMGLAIAIVGMLFNSVNRRRVEMLLLGRVLFMRRVHKRVMTRSPAAACGIDPGFSGGSSKPAPKL